jgi:hypothetical protein
VTLRIPRWLLVVVAACVVAGVSVGATLVASGGSGRPSPTSSPDAVTVSAEAFESCMNTAGASPAFVDGSDSAEYVDKSLARDDLETLSLYQPPQGHVAEEFLQAELLSVVAYVFRDQQAALDALAGFTRAIPGDYSHAYHLENNIAWVNTGNDQSTTTLPSDLEQQIAACAD